MRAPVIVKGLVCLMLVCFGMLVRGDADEPAVSLKMLNTLPLDDKTIQDVYLSDDRRTLLTLDGQGDLRQWDLNTGEVRTLLNVGPASTAVFSQSGRYLACACGVDETDHVIDQIQLIDLLSLDTIYYLKGMFISSIDFSPDEQYVLFKQSYTKLEQFIRIIYIPSLSVVFYKEGDYRWILNAIFVDNTTIAIGYGYEYQIETWDFKKKKQTNTFFQWAQVPNGAYATPIEALAAHPFESLFASINDAGEVFVWKFETQTSSSYKLFTPEEKLSIVNHVHMMFYSTGNVLFIQERTGRLHVWTMNGHRTQEITQNVVFFRLFDDHLITVDEDNVLTLYEIKAVA